MVDKRARVIAFLNMKGGVGKTTIAVNTASALAKLKHRKVLLIDLDPQYNATQYLVDIEKHPDYVNGEHPTVFNIMSIGLTNINGVFSATPISSHPESDKIQLKDVARTLYSEKGGKLDLIPGTLHLINLELAQRGMEHRLQNFVKKIEGAYDYVLIDCPPTFSLFLLSGILASDYYLVPVKPDPLSALGVPLLEAVISLYNEMYEKTIKPLGIVFTMVRETKQMDEVMSGLRKTSAGKRYIFRNSLSNSTYVAAASAKFKPLFEFDPAQRYGQQIVAITEEMENLFD